MIAAKIGAKWQDFPTNSFFLNRYSRLKPSGMTITIRNFYNKNPAIRRGFLWIKSDKEMPRDRIELSTPGFSDRCSTTELPRHYLNIIQNFKTFGNKNPVFRRQTTPPRRFWRRKNYKMLRRTNSAAKLSRYCRSVPSNRAGSGESISSTPHTAASFKRGMTISLLDAASHAICPGN